MKKLVFAVLFLLFTLQVLAQDLPPGDKPAATVFSKVKEAGTKDDFPDADYVIVEDSSICRVNEKGIAYTDMYVVYKALTDGGCKQLAVQRWHYEPLSSFVEVKEVNVIRGDEKIPVDLGGLRDLPAPQSGIYWGDRILLLQLPRLEENDGIEIRAKRKGYSYALLDDDKYIPPMEGQYFDIVVFSAAVPIKSKKYVLKMPVNKRIHSRIYNGPMYSSISYGEDETTYGWWSEDVPAQADEYYGAEATDVYPKVVIATVESWEAKSKWFFDVNEGQFKFTDAIKAKVEEIFEQAGVTGGTEEEKAFALVHWVAQNIRYSGQTMGEGEGYTLHSGAMIFEQRSGVCKDIAGMLITMMRAAGMDSYGAMTMAGSRIEEEVPADQFNHCVVALKKEDGRFVMYDPTWVGNMRDIWSKYETEQEYLLGTPEGEGVRQIPYSPPEESMIKIISTGNILEDGTYRGTFKLQGNGVADSRLRRWLTRSEKGKLDVYLLEMLSGINERVELVGCQHGQLLNFNENMRFTIDFKIPEYALRIGDGYEFTSPMMKFAVAHLLAGGSRKWEKERKTDLFFYAASMVTGTETIGLPKGYQVADPAKSEEIDETYAYFKGDGKMANKRFVIRQTGKIKRRTIPPEGYDGFKQAMEEAQKYTETVFRAEKGEAK